MVGIFSRFSIRGAHPRAQSTDHKEREILHSSFEAATGIEFKAVERPTEPLDNDQPILCPFPDPSILSDGSTWKERLSSCSQRRADTPVVQEQTPVEAGSPVLQTQLLCLKSVPQNSVPK